MIPSIGSVYQDSTSDGVGVLAGVDGAGAEPGLKDVLGVVVGELLGHCVYDVVVGEGCGVCVDLRVGCGRRKQKNKKKKMKAV